MNKFFIEKLIYTGSGVEDVIVEFKNGINAIIGSSDTGKTFIFKSIDFMFAKKKPPTIIEANGYDTLYMILNIGSDTHITLKRELVEGSKLLVYRCSYKEIEGKIPEKYSQAPSAKESMNKFYYGLLGVTDPYYLYETKNKTKKFTIRYLIKYFMLDEVGIIEEHYSPVLINKQNNMRLFDRNGFDFLVSNNNETEKRTQKQVDNVIKIGNQLEIIDLMISESSERLNEKKVGLESESVEYSDSVIESLKGEINDVQSRIITLTSERIELKKTISDSNVQKTNLNETQQRFNILSLQYQNEIERYKFIYQGSHLIDQLPKRKCPVCDNDYVVEEIDSDAMYEAMEIEKSIIHKKQLDLQESISDIVIEIDSINDKIKEKLVRLQEVEEEITSLTNNELSDLDKELADYIQHEQLVSEVENLNDDIERLKTRRTTLESKTFDDKTIEQILPANLEQLIQNGTDLLCSKIASKLEKWLFHEAVSVKFDDSFDLVINDQPRSSFGKGYKSLIHSAYYLALFDVLKTVGTPSYDFMIIDSPLTAYTDKEVREHGDVVISENTINDFYEDLQKEYADKQIIIIDNKKAPENSEVHEIHFSGNKSIGRYGLFPVE